MIGNKTIVGLVITTMVLSCVAVAVTADEGRVEPMGIFPDSITDTEIAEGAVGNSEILNSANFVFADVTANGAVLANGAVTLGDAFEDAITIKGAVTGDAGQNPTFDFSGSTGIFKTGTGAVTLGGATTASSTLTVTDETALNGGLTMDGDFAVADTTGIVTLKNGATLNNNADVDTLTITETTVAITGATTASSSLTVTGATALNGGLDMDSGAFAVADTTGIVTLKNGATLNNNADVDTLTIAETTVAITGGETVSGTLDVTGDTTVVNFVATGDVTLPSGTAVAHLLESKDDVTSVTGTTYAEPTEVLETTNHITTKGLKNFIITYSANTSVSAGEQLIITNISVESSAGVTLKTSTPTNLTFADSYATFMQNTIQVFVEEVAEGTDMDIVVRARKTDGTVSVQNQTLTVIAV